AWGRSTLVRVTVRGLTRVTALVGQLIGAAVGDLAIVVFAIGRAALAHDAFNARCVVQIGVELSALDVAGRLLDVGAWAGVLLVQPLIALMR
ncbi:hypothetical protein ACQKP3_24605, partial [Vibrio sp. DNB22_10_4]